MWVDAFHAGFKNSTQTTDLINAARAANCNALIVQVRKRGDAYYRNGLEPVAADISGSFDPLADLITKANTGSPKIQVHAWVVTYNIWNSESGTPTQTTHPYRLHKDWLSYRHTGETWDGGNYQFDPGHPEAQQHTYDVIMDILTRYNVDGVHFDYVRYSDDSGANNQPWGYNPVSVTRYRQQSGTASPRAIASIVTGNPATIHTATPHGLSNGDTAIIRGVTGTGAASVNGVRPITVVDPDTITLNEVNLTSSATGGTVLDAPQPTTAGWLQWRRNQVTALVRKVYLNAWATKPNARVSASVIAYGSAPPDLTLASWQTREAYTRVLQDWRGWMEEGILDLACPMIYRDKNAASGPTFDTWANFTKDRQYNRAAAIGMGWYLNTVPNTISQIKTTRTVSSTGRTAAGLLGYSYAVTNRYPDASEPDGYEDNQVSPATMRAALVNDATAEIYDPGGTPVFASPVSVPSMPWKTDMSKGHLMGTIQDSLTGYQYDNLTVTVSGPQNRTLTTDGTGFFGAVDLPVGTYTLTFTAPGFRPFGQTVTVTGAAVAQPALTLSRLPFLVTNCTRAPSTVSLTWNSVPGRTYRVEQSQNLVNWTTAQSGILGTEGASTTSYTWTIPAGWSTQAFLRVAEQN